MRAFISYSWDSEEHKNWVRRFADELIRNGIDTTLDQYDLRVGSDRFLFMETAIRDADCILFICTPKYVQRANSRDHGVGAETALVSTRFFEEHSNKLFIPIVRSTTETERSTPDYLASLIFLDFRDDNEFSRRMEELLRHLYGQPEHRKPALGKAPQFKNDQRTSITSTVTNDRELVTRLITFLEDRRVLFARGWGIDRPVVGAIKSIEEIRQRLRDDLERTSRGSQLSDSLWAMQEACRNFLDGHEAVGRDTPIGFQTHVLVREFREIFRNELMKLSKTYSVPMRRLIPEPEELAQFGIPPEQATDKLFDSLWESEQKTRESLRELWESEEKGRQ